MECLICYIEEDPRTSVEQVFDKSVVAYVEWLIYCKGECFMNNDASRFKKYLTLDSPGHSHEVLLGTICSRGLGVRPHPMNGTPGQSEIFFPHTS